MADELGAYDYLVKPVDLGGLAAAIQRRVELKL
jgi:DNA-binding response OmpR family regulator